MRHAASRVRFLRRARLFIVPVLLLFCTTSSFHADENSVITLRNASWDHGALVQVKRGRAQNPADNPDYGSKTLQKGESWSIPCGGQEVAWRRLALGYQNEQFTPWTRDACFDSKTHDV